MTTKEEIGRELDELKQSVAQKELSTEELELIAVQLRQIEKRLGAKPSRRRRSILELDGLGMELWRSIDVDAYLKRERDSWR